MQLFLLALGGYTVQNPVPLATQWLHGPEKKKPRY
jgi:hypothetical protein